MDGAVVKDQKGQQVRVLGQLMVDNEHYVAGQDCARAQQNGVLARVGVGTASGDRLRGMCERKLHGYFRGMDPDYRKQH